MELEEAGVLGLESPLARYVEVYREIDSTQRRARELAASGVVGGTVVLSRVQVGGKGRLGRVWGSPEGGLWMSLVLRPEIKASEAPRTTIVAAVGVAKALRSIGVEAGIKWPNDIIVGERKICGILAESALRTPPGSDTTLDYIVLGIGLNANLDVGDLGLSRDVATTVREQLGHDVEPLTLVGAILSGLQAELSRMDDFDAVLDDWRLLSRTLGSRVRVTTAGGIIEGLAVDIGVEGEILIESEGRRIGLLEGDVERLRSEAHGKNV